MSEADKPDKTRHTSTAPNEKKSADASDETTPPDRRDGVDPDDQAKAKPDEDPNAKKPDEAPKPTRAAELRTAYEKSKTRIKELEGQLEKVSKATADPNDNPQVKALSSRIEQLEKTLSAKESALRVSAFEQSQEYQDKYEAPLKRAFEQAYADIQQLKVTDSEGNERAAGAADFNSLIQMPLPQAIAAAKVFGEASTEVLAHRRRILEMNNNRQQAISEAHSRHENLVKEQGALMTQQRQWWSDENKEAESKYTQWSKPDDTDSKESEILTKATQIADLAFSDVSHLPPKERVKLHAAIRNKARWFDLQAYRNRKLTEKIADLEKKLDEYEESTPTAESVRREAPAKGPATWEDELEALEKASSR